MIIKSLSRKTPSFHQLAQYMSSEKSDEHYDIYHHCYTKGPTDIAAEFHHNSQLLSKRKNGNYLYHEIISVQTTQATCSHEQIKEQLHDIAQRYIEKRCANNMVYGCLHEDHAHNLHYHLMISANERGEKKRLRLTQAKFDATKKETERYVLTQYPELKQKPLMNKPSQGEKLSVKAGELKRRSGKMPRRDEVKETLQAAMSQTRTLENFYFFLEERGYQFYIRGKHYGVEVLHEDGLEKKYRFATLGLHEEFEQFTDQLSESLASQSAVKVPEARQNTREGQKKTAEIENTHTDNSQMEGESQNKVDETIDEPDNAMKNNENNTQEQQEKRDEAHAKTSKQGEDMKARDVFGVHEIQKDRRKEQEAKRAPQEQLEATTRKQSQDTKQQLQQSEDRTAKKTAAEVQKEFERLTEKQKLQDKHSSKNKQ